MAEPKPARLPRLTIGMACYDDFNGVYFTIQSLRLYHADVLDDVEFLVVDNHPDGAEGQTVREFVTNWLPNARYIAAPEAVGTAAPRELLFRRAEGEAVLCLDCHVLLAPGAVRRLLDFYAAHPDCRDLLHGPLLYDNGSIGATHMDPVWRDEMFGVWGVDPRGESADAPPFEVPMHGCGLMSCRKDAWLGFSPQFRGFGGEEGYIHEKFRHAGRRVLCLPSLRWLHRFGRPQGPTYPLLRENRIRNYLLGRVELGRPYQDVIDHFTRYIGREPMNRLLVEVGLPAQVDRRSPPRPARVAAETESRGAARQPEADRRRGSAMAAILAGAWRPVPPPVSLGADDLAAVVPLFRQSTAAPLAWRRLRAAGRPLAKPIRELQTAYRAHAIESAGHEQHLQEVLPILRAAGVEPILIKGWSIARLYPEVGLRPYCDLDLCVRPDQVSTAMKILDKLARRELMVELHQGIPDLKDRTWDEAFRRSRLMALGSVEVRVLGAEDQLRLLCLHQMRHGASAPLWLCDLGVAMEARAADFDWDYCMHGQRARSEWIICWLGLACRLLGARLDEPALATRAANLPSWLAPTVLERWTRPVQDSSLLDPIKGAYRRRLRPYQSQTMTQFLGLVGRLAEVPSRLWRQCRRWRRPRGRPYDLHEEAGS